MAGPPHPSVAVSGPWRPLKSRIFRDLLLANFASDIGTFMQTVGAAWLMVSLGAGPMKVALIQTAETLQKRGLAPHDLEFEVSEAVLATSSSWHPDTLQQLRDLGVGLTIDDFGSDYTSIGRVKAYGVKRFKIAPHFINTMASDPTNAAVVPTMISLANQLGIDLIAKNIETQEQERFLVSLTESAEAQGYFYSAPLSSDADYVDAPVWSADGRTIFFDAFENGDHKVLSSVRADGSQPEQTLIKSDNDIFPVDATADGRWLLYEERKRDSSISDAAIKALPLVKDIGPFTVLEAVGRDSNARLIPARNNWLAYQANQSGRAEITGMTIAPCPWIASH